MVHEFFEETQRAFKVQIYSTDLDEEAIAIARAGFYPPNIAADLTPQRLQRFFLAEDAGYRVKKEIRDMLVFAVQNVISDPPFTRLDLISCRNLMIYLEAAAQDRLIPILHHALRPQGVLFLSPAEGLDRHDQLFAPLNRRWRFYRAIGSSATSRAWMIASLAPGFGRPDKPRAALIRKGEQNDLGDLARQALLQSFAPPSVVTDGSGNIIFVHGDTGRFLRPAPGQATLNVVDMALADLRPELRAALSGAACGVPPSPRRLALLIDGELQALSLSVRPLATPDGSEQLLLVSFHDLASTSEAPRQALGQESPETRRVKELERDLAHTWENLQATIEEQQITNEDLKSTNEELQSTNEQLQSAIEELETSKEELQSINEELVTVNSELQANLEHLGKAQSDVRNLLDNVSGGIIFLDRQLRVRRFTHEATELYPLVASDIGRPLADIKANIVGRDLLSDVRAMLATQQPGERELQSIAGKCYQARLKPYRALDDDLEGVVITFTDVSERVAAEARARSAQQFSESIVDTLREPLLVLDGDLQVVAASRSFYRRFAVDSQQTIGRRLYDLGDGQWDLPALRELLGTILESDQVIEDFAVDADLPGVGPLHMQLNARRIVGEQPLILLAIEIARRG